ncbi:hypothetical protein ANCDUO_06359 [Ancylostoma duodenale]|uniref:Uncharacterized protein n=1 Tax=Ancylostoma duodenale TaxID=51022 RepID=A0A0C2D1U5_9BILA|nr:hypothetical protein ANCDUO_06359 [Ancylostoma duodenale]
MDDFSTLGMDNGLGFVPSETNFIQPGKRPMSSMSPTVISEKKTKEHMRCSLVPSFRFRALVFGDPLV